MYVVDMVPAMLFIIDLNCFISRTAVLRTLIILFVASSQFGIYDLPLFFFGSAILKSLNLVRCSDCHCFVLKINAMCLSLLHQYCILLYGIYSTESHFA